MLASEASVGAQHSQRTRPQGPVATRFAYRLDSSGIERGEMRADMDASACILGSGARCFLRIFTFDQRCPQAKANAVLDGVTITGAGSYGIQIKSGGSASFQYVTVSGAAQGR